MSGRNANYISVNELSKLVSKTPQWIYKMIREKPSFSVYTKIIDGKLMVHRAAVFDVFGVEIEGYTPVYKQDEPKDPLTAALTNQIQALTEQLKTKDQQIEKLTELLEKEQLLLANSTQRIIALTDQMEQLRASTKDSNSTEANQEDSENRTSASDQEEPEQHTFSEKPSGQTETASDAGAAAPRRKSFLDRLRAFFG